MILLTGLILRTRREQYRPFGHILGLRLISTRASPIQKNTRQPTQNSVAVGGNAT